MSGGAAGATCSGLEPGFVTAAGRELFCVRFSGPAPPRLRVLVIPPFAEEMNKCRPLVAATARALAARGCEVLVPDLSGTGDSAGTFGASGWQDWRAELGALHEQFVQVRPAAPAAVLAIRSGSLFLDLAALTREAHVLCWQPVLDGARFLQQFLRLRVMAAKFAGREESVKALEVALAAGESVEVAGYALTPGLAAGLGAVRLDAAALGGARQVTVFEFRGVAASPSPPLQRLVEGVRAAGGQAEVQVIEAEPFWTTQEIARPAAVVARTVAALTGTDLPPA